MAGPSAVYCVDASACALLSEDYPGTTRWHLQRELVACHSQACFSGDSDSSRTARSQEQKVVLIAGSDGRASVTLHPTAEGAALQRALDAVRPSGEGNLVAALKLALLVSRRFPQGSTRVTAFVASAGGAASLAAGAADAAQELRQRYLDAGLALDIAVLCPRDELGEAAASSLDALAGGGSGGGGSGDTGGSGCAACGDGAADARACAVACRGAAEGSRPSSSSASPRLVWLQPVATAAESWQQLEAALELLEGGREAGASGTQPRPAAGSAAPRSALPAHISRGPRQLDPLAPRSGVQQQALCRGESLSRLGHLSSDGMMRPWLPTYASLGKQAAAKGAAGPPRGAAGGPGGGDFCFVEVQPVPRWRTLLKASAGRMLAEAPECRVAITSSSGQGSSGQSSAAGSGDFAAASSQLLRSLHSLSVMDEAELDDGSEGEEAAALAVPLRYRPDPRRGTLRLLQGTKEPHLLKLVWRAEPSGAAAEQPAGQPTEQQPLDMFGGAAPSGGAGGAGSTAPSSRHAELLSYMPASAVTASAARGPLLREGCELWEAAAEFEWELPLPTAEQEEEVGASGRATTERNGSGGAPARRGGAEDGELPAAVEARQLQNGAQVLLISPAPGSNPRGPLRRGGRRRPPATAAFWLQQRLGPESLQLPVYGTASSSLPAVATGPNSPAGELAAAATSGIVTVAGDPGPELAPDGEPAEAQAATAQQEQQGNGGEAALLASALLGMLQQPPRVDLRRLRRDVKSGAIQVTPITVGPLPAQFVRDIVSARSAMLGGMGVENLDSWQSGDEPGANGGMRGPASGPTRNAGSAATGSAGSQEGEQAQGDADASPGPGAGAQGADALPSAAALQKHRVAAYSLLRQRLAKQPLRGDSHCSAEGGTGAGAASCPGEPAAATGPAAALAAGGACLPAAGLPCSSPQPTPTAAPRLHDSCSSSAAGTPFGTPLHILPSPVAQQQLGCGYSQAGAAEAGEAATGMSAAAAGAVAVAGQAVPGLPGAADGCLKREGSSVLASAGSQADGAADALDPLFRME